MIRFVSFEGLNEEETLKEINQLKRSIKHLLNDKSGDLIYPTVETRLLWNRKFLKEGIEHLENDLHVKYDYSKEELKEKEFLDKLKYVKKFTFTYDWSFKVELTFSNDTFEVYSEGMEEYSFDPNMHNTDKTMEAFLEEIFNCHLECWKKYERLPRSCVPTICKYRHKIEIEYYNGYKNEVIKGKYDTHDSFIRLLGYMQALAKGDDYDEI